MKVLFHSIEEGPHLMKVDENDMRAAGLDLIIKNKCRGLHLKWDEERDVIIINDSSIETYYDMLFTPVKEVR